MVQPRQEQQERPAFSSSGETPGLPLGAESSRGDPVLAEERGFHRVAVAPHVRSPSMLTRGNIGSSVEPQRGSSSPPASELPSRAPSGPDAQGSNPDCARGSQMLQEDSVFSSGTGTQSYFIHGVWRVKGNSAGARLAQRNCSIKAFYDHFREAFGFR